MLLLLEGPQVGAAALPGGLLEPSASGKGVWRPFSVVVGKGPLMGELRKGKRIEGF